MSTSTNTFTNQVGNNNTQGSIVGPTSASLIGFYGTTPVAQATIVGSNTLSTAVSSTGAFGFGNALTASTVVHVVNRLVTMGLIG